MNSNVKTSETFRDWIRKRINSSVLFGLFELRSLRQQVQERSPAISLQLLLDDSKGAPKLQEYMEFRVCPMVSSHFEVPGKRPAAFLKAPYLVSKADPDHPTEKHFF
ncbi:hypothetical protein CHARACLAT_010248 [Characodon lateralis]|uniref:Uncharacterized protein n=1 Tax=Characodon lateralis TaxID=208331 RepID=A0ABU7F2U9_9TELE|nr:hypothetical protein [Characodon lateralis]